MLSQVWQRARSRPSHHRSHQLNSSKTKAASLLACQSRCRTSFLQKTRPFGRCTPEICFRNICQIRFWRAQAYIKIAWIQPFTQSDQPQLQLQSTSDKITGQHSINVNDISLNSTFYKNVTKISFFVRWQNLQNGKVTNHAMLQMI